LFERLSKSKGNFLKYSILRAFRPPSAVFPQDTEEPIRSELFSIERLEEQAESLAAAKRVTTKAGRRLARRLRDNAGVLQEAYSAIARAVREERAITPAAEWLIDNYYVAQEQIREI
jgi:cyclic beta-1,2-glucan synthetase